MQTGAQNKGMQAIKYVGHKEAVQHPTDGPTYTFPRDTAVQVPASVAEGLLKQPEKFKTASTEEVAAAAKAKEPKKAPPPAGAAAPKES